MARVAQQSFHHLDEAAQHGHGHNWVVGAVAKPRRLQGFTGAKTICFGASRFCTVREAGANCDQPRRFEFCGWGDEVVKNHLASQDRHINGPGGALKR